MTKTENSQLEMGAGEQNVGKLKGIRCREAHKLKARKLQEREIQMGIRQSIFDQVYKEIRGLRLLSSRSSTRSSKHKVQAQYHP